MLIKLAYNAFGVLKTPDPEDEAEEIINENVQTVIDILKAELEKIKEEIICTLVNTTLDDIQYPQKNLLAISRKKGLYSQGGTRTRTS